jgi:hypothetical protein
LTNILLARFLIRIEENLPSLSRQLINQETLVQNLLDHRILHPVSNKHDLLLKHLTSAGVSHVAPLRGQALDTSRETPGRKTKLTCCPPPITSCKNSVQIQSKLRVDSEVGTYVCWGNPEENIASR